jgi:DNA mismatch repair protein MLH1
MIRNDNSSQKIDSFLANIEEIRSEKFSFKKESQPRQKESTPKKESSPDQKKSLKRKFETDETINGRAKRKNCNLRSMMLLYDEICANKDVDLKNLLDSLIFVGFSSSTNIIVQSQENLLSMDFSQLSEDLFYQIIVRDYSNFDVDEFETPIDIPSLLQLSNLPPEKWECLLVALKNLREMLLDYFGIRIDENYNLCGMPKILDNYRPEFNKIYKFFEELEDTNWKEEGKCLKSISKALAKFYSFSNYHRDELEYLREVMENTVFPIFKSHFFMAQISDEFSEPVKLTSLPALYKVFERC